MQAKLQEIDQHFFSNNHDSVEDLITNLLGQAKSISPLIILECRDQNKNGQNSQDDPNLIHYEYYMSPSVETLNFTLSKSRETNIDSKTVLNTINVNDDFIHWNHSVRNVILGPIFAQCPLHVRNDIEKVDCEKLFIEEYNYDNTSYCIGQYKPYTNISDVDHFKDFKKNSLDPLDLLGSLNPSHTKMVCRDGIFYYFFNGGDIYRVEYDMGLLKRFSMFDNAYHITDISYINGYWAKFYWIRLGLYDNLVSTTTVVFYNDKDEDSDFGFEYIQTHNSMVTSIKHYSKQKCQYFSACTEHIGHNGPSYGDGCYNQLTFYTRTFINTSSGPRACSSSISSKVYIFQLQQLKQTILGPIKNMIPIDDIAKLILGYTDFQTRLDQLVRIKTLIPSKSDEIEKILCEL